MHLFHLTTWVCVAASTCAFADVRNASFDDGVLDWKASWHVEVKDAEAVLTDTRANHAFLFQSVPVEPGEVTVQFDFRAALSTNWPAGTFRDTAFASLYGVDNPAAFVLPNDRAGMAQGLFDVDGGGVFNLKGSISASPKGPEWSRFSARLTTPYRFVVVVFELYDLTFVTGDSSLRVDNVEILQEVPQ